MAPSAEPIAAPGRGGASNANHQRSSRSRASPRVTVAGVSISHPTRTLEPAGVTKLELARYYEAIGPTMVPHVRGRPLTLVRWAEGEESEKGGVYLRHARAWGPRELRRISVQEKKKLGEYLVADDVRALVALAQMDILEIHTWNSTAGEIEDRIASSSISTPRRTCAGLASSRPHGRCATVCDAPASRAG